MLKQNKIKDNKKEIKRNIKETVFSDLFSIPKYKLQLYQTLHPEDKDIKEEDLKIISLKNVICNGVVNDYSLNARNKIITFCEAQMNHTQIYRHKIRNR